MDRKTLRRLQIVYAKSGGQHALASARCSVRGRHLCLWDGVGQGGHKGRYEEHQRGIIGDVTEGCRPPVYVVFHQSSSKLEAGLY